MTFCFPALERYVSAMQVVMMRFTQGYQITSFITSAISPEDYVMYFKFAVLGLTLAMLASVIISI